MTGVFSLFLLALLKKALSLHLIYTVQGIEPSLQTSA